MRAAAATAPAVDRLAHRVARGDSAEEAIAGGCRVDTSVSIPRVRRMNNLVSSKLAEVGEEFLAAYRRGPEVMFQLGEDSRLMLRVGRIDWVTAAVSTVNATDISVAAPMLFDTVLSMTAGVAVTVDAPC